MSGARFGTSSGTKDQRACSLSQKQRASNNARAQEATQGEQDTGRRSSLRGQLRGGSIAVFQH